MNEKDILDILNQIKDGSLSVDNAFSKLRNLPFEDIGYAKIDHHRAIRNGYPEVIFCQGKSIEHIIGIIKVMQNHGSNILATRATIDVYNEVKTVIPDAEYHSYARIISIKKKELLKSKSKIIICTAGTADIPVAEEAAVTAEFMGNTVERIFDVGVAGIHRLFANVENLNTAGVIIAVAGMEGALASVIGGLVDKPVIAVPTSVGYGASFNGLAALLAMLNSCASGVGVVNIDNGFGAAYLASTINRQIENSKNNPEK